MRTHSFPVFVLAAALAACSAETSEDLDPLGDDQAAIVAVAPGEGAAVLALERTVLTGDIAEWSVTLQVGPEPADRVRLHRVVRERAPFVARKSGGGAMLLHGDFSTFDTNFGGEAGLAAALAAKNLDVWGVDRRWTLLGAGDDLGSLVDQGFAVGIADTRIALAVARGVRALGGHGAGRLALIGFSRGAHIAYAYAGDEATRPAAQRHVDALVPIDIYARLDAADEALRQGACARAQEEEDLIAAGMPGADNSFFQLIGGLAAELPDDDSPVFPGLTNRGALLTIVGQTYQFYGPTPSYHLAAGVIEDEAVVDLVHAPATRIAEWFAAAPAWQSQREVADSDALWCGDEPPFDDHLAAVAVPIYSLAAAGGFGEHTLASVEATASNDVTAVVVTDQVDAALDVGHADLLFGDDAAAAWAPLADWLLAH
jgi:hypothetical protein